jgi:signal transduction histidine kinase
VTRRRPGLPGWICYLGAGAAAIALSQLRPELPGLAGWRSYTFLYLLVNASAVAAIGFGIYRYRPARPAAWLFVLANQAVYFVGDFLFYVGRNEWHWTSFPGPSDAFYIGHYPLLAAGLVVMVHRRRDTSSRQRLADGLIAGVGFAVLSWIALIAPNASAPGSLLAKVTSVAYPVLDLVIFLVGLQLLFGGQRKSGSVKLLVSALVLLFVTDGIYAWMQLHGTYSAQQFLDVMWLSYYLLLGASALHPSMRRAAERAETAEPLAGSPGRYVMLFVLTLLTPALALYHGVRGDTSAELPVVLGSLVLFILVGLRMFGLIRHQRALLGELSAAQADRSTLLGQMVGAAENERARIAADLHDGPIQHLASTVYTLDRAVLTFGRDDAAKTPELLSRIRDNLFDEVTALRQMMTGLRPAVLDNGGLAAAVEHYVRGFAARTGVVATVECELDNGELGSDDETVLYRVCQEALTNVARHSRATAVRVTLGASADCGVELSIQDNGIGLDTRRARELVRLGHFGLAGMRERVEAAGGQWALRSTPGHGAEVNACIPMRHAGARTGPGLPAVASVPG